MKTLINRLYAGEGHFSSGGRNSEQFNTFFNDFLKSFTYQLKRLKATEIEFSKGHFELSGFFKINEQHYYFSLGDVRHGYIFNTYSQKPELLIRTTQYNKDYTGGQNTFVAIQDGMYKEIARKFNLEISEAPKRTKKTDEDYVKQIIKDGFLERKFTSCRKANWVAWELYEQVTGGKSTGIQTWKIGRWLSRAEMKNDYVSYYYDAESKRATFSLNKITDEQLIKGLKIGKNKEYRTNVFSGKGVTLEPLAVALHDRIKQWESSNHVNLFHIALNIFRKKYSDEYYVLLD